MKKVLCALVMSSICSLAVRAQSVAQPWQQCGGSGWTGATTCVSGYTCVALNPYYSQCIPNTSSSGPTITTTTTTSSSSSSSTTTTTTTTTSTSSTSSAPSGTCAPNSPPPSAGKVKFSGINIAGFDFGCDTNGDCQASSAWPPLTQYYGHDGQGQMNHFVKDDGFNIFRLPTSWQFLVNNILGDPIDEANFQEYDALVQACVTSGAAGCLIDIHNYARWNGEIIGQGGPTDQQFASFWGDLAGRYANNTKVLFGVMNEPHDIPDIQIWAETVQAAVTAIRQAGATSQIILLPGNDWTSAETFVSNGSGAALSTVTNPDGSITNLVFDVHKYLDSDNSGTHADCVTNNIDDAWEPLSQWLRCNGRQALNTETGGGNTDSCSTYMCQQVAYQNQNSDVLLGYIGWAAGNFDPSYVLSEVPTDTNGVWTDTSLRTKSVVPFLSPCATRAAIIGAFYIGTRRVVSYRKTRANPILTHTTAYILFISDPTSSIPLRTPVTVPCDSPSNPFGLKRSLIALELPPPTLFRHHIALRFQLVDEQKRIGKNLIVFLFATDIDINRVKSPKAGVRRKTMTATTGRVSRARASSIIEPTTKGKGKAARTLAERRAQRETRGADTGSSPGAKTWFKSSSIRDRRLFKDVFDPLGLTDDESSNPLDEDEPENGAWRWEAEDDLTLGTVWPDRPNLERGIIYHHSPSVSVHITANTLPVEKRRGHGNEPHIFLTQGSAESLIRVAHLSPEYDGREGSAAAEDELELCATPDSETQIARWNESHAFSKFLKEEGERERAMRRKSSPPSPFSDASIPQLRPCAHPLRI
ncbi:hypothetical protein NM688_g4191 [Phlebia brevispora]|uniref:Uncharacterized protein n=1 Tax=Phlebia brevispora TaxID=194682 RepID=A0ACC1T3K6_9APHY|nr:hypothetical protein NM688_g4191 [Phlebia brevispora]